MATLRDLDKRILGHAAPHLLLSSFGKSKIPKEKWFNRILYFLKLKKRPSPMPGVNLGDTITFRRPHKFTTLREK